MGKYMMKGKGVGKVGVMEISQASLGLRTRARALALEKDQKPAVSKPGSSKPQESPFHERRQTAYLELRSRTLEKVIFPFSTDISSQAKDLRKAVSERKPSRVSSSEMLEDSSAGFMLSEQARQNPQLRSSPVSEADCQQFECGKSTFGPFEASMGSSLNGSSNISLHQSNSVAQNDTLMATVSISRSNSVSIFQDRPRGMLTRNQRRQEKRIMMAPNHMEVDKGAVKGRGVEARHFGNDFRNTEVEASFGDPMDHDRLSAKDRERESTLSSYTRDRDAPASATRSSGRERGSTSATLQGKLPDSEIEDFFRSAEQEEQRRFTVRYNFDPVNDRPLTGQYEWVRM